ncbi:hypothetical protein GTQ99_00265 [Kineococcus sp. T13]|uniref:hypothetical protein n=1 Tax=Kineococcus vitellinus TaxID=2696565 RepID=UPI001411D583|nr:hypothetical protein [Kineococcus vitellinus]NAZ73864.1 hypothetical protein [Kineococcus vitellinus]
MDAGDWLGAIAALVGALVGGGAAVFAGMYAARRASRSAVRGASADLIALLLQSDDPALRARGKELLFGSVEDLATSPDVPEATRRAAAKQLADDATRSSELDQLLDRARSLMSEGDRIVLRRPQEGQSDE